ncbi:MAG TPA: tetraacyldisaccharide 4'-kinase, partial [Terriglobales bacterium]
QHRRLARDFDIVLLNPEDLTDSVVPGGRLREDLNALRRADAVVLSEGMKSADLLTPVKNIWYVRRRLSLPSVPGPVIAFAGVARPQRFFDELLQAGIDLKEQVRFRDHYRYHASDVRHLLRLRKRKGAAGFITTEKDAMNLGPHLKVLDPIVVPLKLELLAPEEAFTVLSKVINRRGGPASP